MENNRIIAIACAVIALILVIIAGKSCAEDISKANKVNKSIKSTNTYTSYADDKTNSPQNSSPAENSDSATQKNSDVEYDLFGNVITTEPESLIEDKSESPTENVTIETDAFGETITDSDEIDIDDFDIQPSTAPPVISGYNHGEYDEEGNTIPEKPTLPPDFTLIVQ
ncbi:MAG: hypothetical protein J6Y71_04925 [Ruminococcus sp.]|nr:hypothetical protein [Ruminococcus sp.]